MERRYRDRTLVHELDFHTDTGSVRIVDFMPPRGRDPDVVRIVEGLDGEVEVGMELVIRFDYGSIVPWVRRVVGDHTRIAVAGPDAISLQTPVEVYGQNLTTVATFTVSAGQRLPFVLTWFPSHHDSPAPIDPDVALADTCSFWRDWAGTCSYSGRWSDAVMRSLIVLKALTYEPTGGIVAAATTSLPEQIGGVRNWDYRYCWLRDASFALDALVTNGFIDEARAWRRWLLRAVAGDPEDLQIMYGPAGERRLPEFEIPWLPGYEGSSPVRIGNGASTQFQLDVFGEVLDLLHEARHHRLEPDEDSWALQRKLLESLEVRWREPDEGIWEVRGPRRHFTHSKVMAWVALDRGVKAVEEFGREGPVERWREIRDEIHAEVLERGFDRGAELLRAVLRLHPPRRVPPDGPARRLPAPGGSARPRNARGRSARPAARRVRPALLPRRRRPPRSTGSRRARARSSSAPSGSSTTWPCSASSTRRARCSTGCCRSGTSSACSPRSTTPSSNASSATSRRRSRTSASSTRRSRLESAIAARAT